jgi:hypothetical protein
MSLLDALLLDPAPFQIWIADRADRQKGSGTANDPFDGGAGKFDGIMNQFAATANLMIRLGPGVFTTKGYADGVAGGWQAKPGMKILGSGVAVTKLQLSGVTQNGVQYFVVGHDLATANLAVAPVDAFEISDLEIDCGSNIAATKEADGGKVSEFLGSPIFRRLSFLAAEPRKVDRNHGFLG